MVCFGCMVVNTLQNGDNKDNDDDDDDDNNNHMISTWHITKN
jgi:hypothetical protein